MPLLSPSQLNPGIAQALKEAGLEKKPKLQKQNLEVLLEENGLGSSSVLKQVGDLMVFAEQENTRLAAAKIGLQLNRLLDSDETGSKIPIVNILIQDSEYVNLNPILIPR